MPNEHEQGTYLEPGEVWVDTSDNSVRRAGDTPDEDETIARTRTTPTRHDGTQSKR